MKRAIRWLLLAVALLVVALGIVVFWALRTESGLRYVIGKAVAATDGKLAIGSAEGTLAGPLVLHQLRWRDAGVDAQVGRVTLDIAPLALLR